MRRVLIGIAFAGVLIMVRFGLHAYYVHQAEDQAMDAYVDARLSQPISMPLACPPLGQHKVTFLTEESTPEVTKENAPAVQMRWQEIWPAVYQGIQNETADAKVEQKKLLGEKVEIQIDLPSKLIVADTEWEIEFTCAGGHFTTDMKGFAVGQTQFSKNAQRVMTGLVCEQH